MEVVGALAAISLAFVLILLVPLVEAIHKYCLKPTRIRRTMAAQGIGGPPYRFIYGNTKELSAMQMEVRDKPLERLSHDIFPKVQPHIHAWIKQYGRNYLNWFGHLPELVITEPESVKEVLVYQEKAYSKVEQKGYGHRLLGDGLVTVVDREKWAKQRKLANHAFHGESLKKMVPAMVDGAEMMFERWERERRDGKEVDVYPEFKLLTSEIISRTAFGSNYVEGRNIFEMLNELAILTFKNFSRVRIPGISVIWKTTDEIEGDKLMKGIRNSILNMVERREAKHKAGDADGFGVDFLGQLLKAYHDTDKSRKITTETLIDECKTFYFAGQETTNGTLAWTVFLLATNPNWQEEARKEVFRVFGARNPDLDGIPKLRMMTMILNESLRLYPPVIGLTRTAAVGARLGKLRLPCKTQIYIPTLVLHHNPEIWGPDAHAFKPERFSEGVVKATNSNLAAFFPFGLGPRSCVGMNFAMTEVKIVLSMILQRYAFALSPTYVHCPVQQLTTRPMYGIQVTFKPLP